MDALFFYGLILVMLGVLFIYTSNKRRAEGRSPLLLFGKKSRSSKGIQSGAYSYGPFSSGNFGEFEGARKML